MIKEKINGILNKIKNNKKKVIGITAIVFAVFIFTFTVYNLNNPTYFNRLFANVLNNGKPANDAFEDNNFYSCVVDAYNGDHKDNKKAYNYDLTNKELASITNLTCQGWDYSDDEKITSAKGIEKLTGLTTLDLSFNQLASIDLSKNTSLEYLYLRYNQLTSIDLSQNIALTELNLEGNKLSDIDLSQNANLTELDLQSNLLTNIDLSKNTNLTKLNLEGNKLSDIDLSQNANLTELDLQSNLLTNIDLSKNTNLTKLNLEGNKLSDIDLSKNTSLEYLYLRYNQLTSIDLSQNIALTELNLEGNKLSDIDLSKNTFLEYLYLSNNQLTSIDLSKNTSLTALILNSNQLTSIDLSKNTSLRWLDIDNTPLKEDILIQTGETYEIEEKIIPPEGQNITYSIVNTSVATVEGNIISVLKNENTDLIVSFGNISFTRSLIGSIRLYTSSNYIEINNDKKYIYLEHVSITMLNDDDIGYYIYSNYGNVVMDGDTIKVVSGDRVYLEYKLVTFNGILNWGHYTILYSSTEEPNKYHLETTLNCTYEFLNDGREVSIKYDSDEIDRKKVVYMYLPENYKFIEDNLISFSEDLTTENNILAINNINEIEKDKVNIKNAKKATVYHNPNGNDYINIHKMDDDTSGSSDRSLAEIEYSNIFSNNYNLIKDYIYLGTDDFANDIKISGSIANYDYTIDVSDDKVSLKEGFINWDLIKVSSDKYDMSGDTINLGNEDIDLSKINVTNATLKKDNNKLLIMYGDEVVKEFKLEGGKKTTTTTKKNDEKTTTTKVKTTTKKETKTITTKKKVNIIDKIFGNKETTTAKKEETTTKKNIFRKSTTTKVENSSGNATSNNKNSFKKLVTGSNLLILLLSITGIALIIYIIIMKKNSKAK